MRRRTLGLPTPPRAVACRLGHIPETVSMSASASRGHGSLGTLHPRRRKTPYFGVYADWTGRNPTAAR